MAELKTKATNASVEEYIESRASDGQKADCQVLMSMFKRITNQSPKMWGPSIVGYGSYRYENASGRTGETCLTGFAIRGRELVVYLSCEDAEDEKLLARLGKHRKSKACLYFKRLADLDSSVLEQLVINSINAVQRRYDHNTDA